MSKRTLRRSQAFAGAPFFVSFSADKSEAQLSAGEVVDQGIGSEAWARPQGVLFAPVCMDRRRHRR